MSGGGAGCSEYKSTGEGAAPVGAELRGEELSMEDVGPSNMEKKERKALQQLHSL